MRALVIVSLALAGVLVHATMARAQAPGAVAPSVMEGAALYAEADFEGAIERLERALANETLSVADVELALDRIAAAQLALGTRTLDRTLARLALVARDHRFGADVPQALAQRFERVAPTVAPIEVQLTASPLASGRERVSASAPADPLDIVRAVELRCGGLSELGVGPSLEVALGTRCEAIVRGPGGVTLARARRAPSGSSAAGAGSASSQESSLDALWIGLGIGGGVLVVGAVIAGVAVATSSGGSSNVTVVGPVITF